MWVGADEYSRYMGRWSSVVAGHMLERLQPQAGGAWLDVGCGTGDVLGAVLDAGAPSQVVGIDLSPEHIEGARPHWAGRPEVRFEVGSAEDLPFPTASFDGVVSGLAINHIPNSHRALVEMARVVKPGGVVGAYVWDYDDPDFFLTRFWVAAEDALGERAVGDERGRWSLCSRGGLEAATSAAGMAGAHVFQIRIPTVFADRDELWEGFLLGVGPSGTAAVGMDAAEAAAARASFEASLPPDQQDGAVRLTATAWAFAWQTNGQ